MTRDEMLDAAARQFARAAIRVKQAEDRTRQLETADQRIRTLHARVELAPDGRTTVCGHCHYDDGMFVDWPCPTIQALDG